MKKRLFVVCVIFALMFAFSLGSVSVYANEVETYTFSDESATSVFTLVDESKYTCTTVNSETGDTIELSGTYNKQDNRITFYLAGEVLLDAEIGENNVLVEFEEQYEVEEETEAEEYVTQVVEYIIAGVLGLLGTTGVAVLFRSQLKKLINSILDGIKALWKNKENAEEELNAIKNNVDSTLASLQNVKEELVDTNKHEFEALSKKVNLLCEVVLYMAGGMKELVINGTAESISDALKEIDGEVIDNASKEV